MNQRSFQPFMAVRHLLGLACLVALTGAASGTWAAEGDAAVAGAATAVAGVIGRIDLDQHELTVGSQRHRWDPKRLRVLLGGHAADPLALRVGQFVVLQLETGAGAERRIVAIQVGTVH